MGILDIYAFNFLPMTSVKNELTLNVRHVTGNDQDYLRKIPRAVVQISALL